MTPSAHPSAADRGLEPRSARPESCRYRAYGLALVSEIPLPELDVVDSSDQWATDTDALTIRRAPVDGPMPTSDTLRLVRFAPDCAYFAWNGIGRIMVEHNRTISVDADPGVGDGILGLVLLGPVLATILHARGRIILHGSAVEVAPRRTALFLGDNGAGKSTLAAAFLAAGHAVLADDVIAVDTSSEAPHVLAAYPAMKLSREAIAALSPLPARQLPEVVPNAAKLRLRFDRFDPSPCPLDRLYVIERGEQLMLDPLGPPDALRALMRYGYMLKFGSDALAGDATTAHFVGCAGIAHRANAWRLSVPAGLGCLPEVIAALTADCSR